MIKLMQYLIDNLKLIIKRDKLFYYDMTPTEAMLLMKNEVVRGLISFSLLSIYIYRGKLNYNF